MAEVETSQTPALEPVSAPAPEPEPEQPAPSLPTLPQDSITIIISEAIGNFLRSSFDDLAKTFMERLREPVPKESEIEDVKELKATPTTPSPPPPTFNVLYTRNLGFVGRLSALNKLFGLWKPGKRGRIAVVGLGGIGKTELVLEFVYRLHEISPATPIFWDKGNNIQPDSADSTTLHEWLNGPHTPDSLLVVDPGASFEVLEEKFGQGKLISRIRHFEGTVILIARSFQQGTLLAASKDVLELEELELEAATVLLRESLGTHTCETPEIQLHEVVHLMTCLPRAIVQVATLLNGTGMTVSQFLDLYKKSDAAKLRLLGRIEPVSRPDPNFSVVGKGVVDIDSFRLAYPSPCRVLYQLYHLGGTAVPKCIFEGVDELEMIVTLHILKGQFLVAEDTSSGKLTIHRFVYLAICNLLQSEPSQKDENKAKEQKTWYEEVVVSFSKHYPDSTNEDRSWWTNVFRHLLSNRDMNSDIVQRSVATIYYKDSKFFQRKGQYTQALQMATLAKASLPDPIPHEYLIIVQDQVGLLDQLAKYRDVQKALQSYPADHKAGLLWKKRMGARLEDAECANRYNSAIELFHQIQTAQETESASKGDILLAIDDYAWALMLKGRYQDAATECRKALLGRSAHFGNGQVDTLTSFHNLAEILKRAGEFDEALRCIQDGIRGRENVHGADHPETLHSKAVKASILISKAVTVSEFDDAETLLVNAMNKLGAILGDLHPIVMTCQSDRAVIMLARGNYAAAEQIIQAVLEDQDCGPWLEPVTHPDTLTSRHLLAEVLRLKEGCKAADAMSEQALTERTDVLTNGTKASPDFHPDQLTSLHHRAIVLSGLGSHLPALQKIDLALTGRKAILRGTHPDIYLSMTWKGEIMRTQLPNSPTQRTQTLDAIDALHKTALEGLTSIFGPEHQSTLQCLTNTALAKFERGVSGQGVAEGLYRQVHAAYVRTLGELHPETLKSKTRFAEALRVVDKANMSEAKRLWREACAGFVRCCGEEAYVTVCAYRGLEKFLKMYPEG